MANNIKVVIKVRPLIKREIENDAKILWKVHDNSISTLDSKDNGYVFDRVFPETSSTQDLYDEVARSIVESSLAGINGTIFAYGQTSSGKTFTMMGDKRNPGIIPLSVYNLFNEIQKISDRDFLLRVSYIEIYNEKIIDLLDPSNKDIKIFETPEAGVKVSAKEELTSSPEDILRIMKKGEPNRHVGGTNMNECSSRSHTIFQIIIESKEHNTDDGGAHDSVNVSHLNLVDLAGSERVSQTGATGQRFKEGANINKSLSTLSMVIKQLSDAQGDHNRFVSFRDSKLTRILQTSLGGNAKTHIICTVTPATLEETHSTLQFAARAKSIQNKPEVNTIMSEATMLKKLTKQLSTLQMELDHKKDLETDNKLLTDKIKELHKIILNSIRSTAATDDADAAQRRSDRRKTWCPSSRSQTKILAPNREHDLSDRDFVRSYVTPTVMRYKSEGKPHSSRQSSLYDIPEDFNVAEPSSARSSGRHTPEDNIGLIRIVNNEVICLSDDDEAVTSAATKIIDCNSPHHICFKPNGTPPCVLKELITKSQKEYEELVEMTTFEKLNPGEVGDLMNKINYNRRLMLKIENALTDQNTMLKETESRLAEKEALLSQKKVEIFDLQKAVEEIGKKNDLINELEKKITDLERASSENSAQNDSLSQKLKLCEQERDTAVANEKRLSSDLKLLQSSFTDTEIRLEMTVSKAARREKELLGLLKEVPNDTPTTCLDKSQRNFLDASCDVSFFKSDDDSMQESVKNPDELFLKIEKLEEIINKNKDTINGYVATVNELNFSVDKKSNEIELLKVTLQGKIDELTQNKELMKRLTDDNESFKTLVFDLRKPDDHKNIIICNLREEIRMLKSSSLEALLTNLSHLMNELNSTANASEPLTVGRIINTLEGFVFNGKVSFMKGQFIAFVNSLMKHRVLPNENNECTNRLNEQLIQQRLTFVNKYEDFQNLLLEINRRLQNIMVIYNSQEVITDEAKYCDSVHKDLAEIVQYVEAIIDESLTNTNDQLVTLGSEGKVPRFDFQESLVLKIQNNILQTAFDTSIKQCKEYENITQAIYKKLCIVDGYIKGGISSHELSADLNEILPIDHSDLLKYSDHFKSIEDSISLFQRENISLCESKTVLLTKIENLASRNECYEDKLLSIYKTLLEISQHGFESSSDEINDAITRIDYLLDVLRKVVAEHKTLLNNQTELTMSMEGMVESNILLKDEIKSLNEQINNIKAEYGQVLEKLNKDFSIQREATENNSKECNQYKNAMISMREKILIHDQCYQIDCDQSDICINLDKLIDTMIAELIGNKESLKQMAESEILFNDEIKSLKKQINNIKTEDMQVFEKLNKEIAVQQEAYQNTSKESKQYENFITSVYEKLSKRDQYYEVDCNQTDLCLSLDELIKTMLAELIGNKETLQQLEKNMQKLEGAEREIEDLKKEIEQSNEVVQTLLEKSSSLVNINVDENSNAEPVKSIHIMCKQLDNVITTMHNEVKHHCKEMANLQNHNTALEQLKQELQEADQNTSKESKQYKNFIMSVYEKLLKRDQFYEVDSNQTDLCLSLDELIKTMIAELMVNKESLQQLEKNVPKLECAEREIEDLKKEIEQSNEVVQTLLEKSSSLVNINIDENLNAEPVKSIHIMCKQLDSVITTMHNEVKHACKEMANLQNHNTALEQLKQELQEAGQNTSKESKQYKNFIMSVYEKLLKRDQFYEVDSNQTDLCLSLDELIKTMIAELMVNKESLQQLEKNVPKLECAEREIEDLKKEIEQSNEVVQTLLEKSSSLVNINIDENLNAEPVKSIHIMCKQLDSVITTMHNEVKHACKEMANLQNHNTALEQLKQELQEAGQNTSKESKQYKNFIMSVYEKLLKRDQCYEVDSNQTDLCLSLDELIKTMIAELMVNKERLLQLEKNVPKLECAEREIEELKKEIEQSNEVVQTLLEKSLDMVNINIDENVNVEPVKSTHIMCQLLDNVFTTMHNEVKHARKEMTNIQNHNIALVQLKQELQEAYQNSEQIFTNEIEAMKQDNLGDKNEIMQSQNVVRALLEKTIKLGDYHIGCDFDEKPIDLMCEQLEEIVNTLVSRLRDANLEIVKIQDINKAMQLKQEHQEASESSKQILLTELETLKQQKCFADNDRIKLFENTVKMLLQKSLKLGGLSIDTNLKMNVIDSIQMCKQLDEIITTLHSQLQCARTEMAELRDSNNALKQSKREIQEAYKNSKEIFLTEIETLKQNSLKENDKIKEFENLLQGLLAKSLKLTDGVGDTKVEPVDFAHMCQQLEAVITGVYDQLKQVNTEITDLKDSNKALERLKEDLQNSDKLWLTEMETLKKNVSIDNDKIKHFVHGIHLLLENSAKSIETSGDHGLNVDPTELTHTYERLERIITSINTELNRANIEISKLQDDNKTLEQLKNELQEANTKSLIVIETLKQENASVENDKDNFERVENFLNDLRNIFISRIDAVSDETFENSVNLLKHIQFYLKGEDEKLKLKNDEILQLLAENECLKQRFEQNASFEEFGNCIMKIYKAVVDIIPYDSECCEEILDNSLSRNINGININLDKLIDHLELIMKSNVNMKDTIVLLDNELNKNIIENQIINSEKTQFFNASKNKEAELQRIIRNQNEEISNLKEENGSLSFEIQLLLPSIEALTSKITSHYSNLATLQATAYAEDKLLRSHLTSLSHHHSRLHEYCQQNLSLVKEQLRSLIPMISTKLPSNQLQETVLLSSRDFAESTFSNSTLKNSNDIGDSLSWCDDQVSARKSLLKTATFLKDDSDVLAERNDIQKLVDDLQSEKVNLLKENESLSTKLIETLQDCDDLESKVLKLESLLKQATADADSQTDEVLHQNCNNLITSLRNEYERMQTEIADGKLTTLSFNKNTSISGLAENVTDRMQTEIADGKLTTLSFYKNTSISGLAENVTDRMQTEIAEGKLTTLSFDKNTSISGLAENVSERMQTEIADGKLTTLSFDKNTSISGLVENVSIQTDCDLLHSDCNDKIEALRAENALLLSPQEQNNDSSKMDISITVDDQESKLRFTMEALIRETNGSVRIDGEMSNFELFNLFVSVLKMQINNVKSAHNDEIKRLIEDKNCIYREFQHKNAEFEKLILQLQQFNNDNDEFKKGITELESERKRMDNLDIELRDSKTQNQTLKNDNEILKTTIKELESKHKNNSNLIDKLNSEIKCIEHKIYEVTKKNACSEEQYNKLKDVNNTLSDKFDKEQKLLESFRNENDIMKNTAKKSEISNTNDKRLLDSLKAELEDNRNKLSLCRKTEEQHLESMRKTKRLQEDYDSIKEANSKLLLEVNMLSSIQDEIIRKNKEIESLKSEIEMLNNSCVKKDQQISSLQMNKKLMDSLKAELEDNKIKLGLCRKTEEYNFESMSKTKRLQEDYDRIKEANSNLLVQVNILSSIQTELTQKNKEIESLKSEIDMLNNSCVKKDQQISSLQINKKLMDSLKAELEDNIIKLSLSRKTEENHLELVRKTKRLQEDYDRIKEANCKLLVQVNMLPTIRDEITQKNKEIESLKSEIEMLNNSCLKKDQQILNLQMNKKLLQQKIDASVKETLEIIKLKEKEKEKFTKDYENYKKMASEEKEALSKEIELLMARPQKSACEEKEPNLEAEINRWMTDNQALSAELDSVKIKLEQTEKTLEEVNEKCKELDYECDMCFERIKEAEMSLRDSRNARRSLEAKVAELQSEVDSYFNNTADVAVNASRRKRQSMHDSNRPSIGGDHSLKMEIEKDVKLVDLQEKVELLKKEKEEQSAKMINLEEKYAQSIVKNKPSCTMATNTEMEWKGVMSFAIDKITYESEVEKNRQLQAVLEEQKKKIRVLNSDLRRLQQSANQPDENTIQIYKNRKEPQIEELAEQLKLLESTVKHKDDLIKELRREVSRHNGAEARLKEVHLNKAEEVSSRRSSGGSPTDFRVKRQHVFDQNRTVSDLEPAEKVSTQEFSESQFYKEVYAELTRIYKELKMTRDHNESSPIEAQIIKVLDQICMKNTPIAKGSGVIEGQKLSDCYLEIRRLKKVNIKLLEELNKTKCSNNK